MTQDELDAIRQRAEAATSGPWDNTSRTHGQPCKSVGRDTWPRETIANCSHSTVADATFIAHAREDVPALLDEVERLRTEVERLKRRNSP